MRAYDVVITVRTVYRVESASNAREAEAAAGGRDAVLTAHRETRCAEPLCPDCKEVLTFRTQTRRTTATPTGELAWYEPTYCDACDRETGLEPEEA